MALSNAQICQLLESNFCSTLFIHSMQTITVFKVFFLIHQLNPSSDLLQAQRGLNLISISLVAPSLDRRPPHPPWVDLGPSTNFLWNIHTFLARNQTWDQLGFFPEKKLLAICTGLVLHSHLQVLMGSMSHSSMGLSTTTVCTLSLHCTGPCDFSKGFLFYSHLCQPTSTMLQLWGAQSCFGILVQEVSGVYFFTCCLSKVHTSLGHCTMCAILGRGGKLSPCHT